jgi:hypothetical protein
VIDQVLTSQPLLNKRPVGLPQKHAKSVEDQIDVVGDSCLPLALGELAADIAVLFVLGVILNQHVDRGFDQVVFGDFSAYVAAKLRLRSSALLIPLG